jgi:hypothetical protein
MWLVGRGDYFRLSYSDGCEFVLDRWGTQIWGRGPKEASAEYLASWVLGPVFGLLLRLRGTICLHGSAVAVGTQAVALVGPQGAGKSTTAAAFAQMGFAVLTDDMTALMEEDHDYLILPGDPNLCLWPQSVAYLFGSAQALPLIISENLLMPEWEKRYLDLTAPGYRFQSQPLPLAAIYFLAERRSENAPRVEAIAGQAAIVALLGNSFASTYLGRDWRGQEFEALNRLAAQVPLRRIIPHTDAAYLYRICEVILGDFHALTEPPSLHAKTS